MGKDISGGHDTEQMFLLLRSQILIKFLNAYMDLILLVLCIVFEVVNST